MPRERHSLGPLTDRIIIIKEGRERKLFPLRDLSPGFNPRLLRPSVLDHPVRDRLLAYRTLPTSSS